MESVRIVRYTHIHSVTHLVGVVKIYGYYPFKLRRKPYPIESPQPRAFLCSMLTF